MVPATERTRATPVRTCSGCRATAPARELVRLVLGDDGEVVPDLAGGAFGRGAWVHASVDCLQKAPRGLSRSFKMEIRTSAAALAESLGVAASRRIQGLLASARRAGKLAVGSTAVKDALEASTAQLLVVATDARAAADTEWVRRAVADGRAVAFGTKDVLGAVAGRDEAGVVAILDDRIATALAGAFSILQMAETVSRAAPAGGATEVG